MNPRRGQRLFLMVCTAVLLGALLLVLQFISADDLALPFYLALVAVVVIFLLMGRMIHHYAILENRLIDTLQRAQTAEAQLADIENRETRAQELAREQELAQERLDRSLGELSARISGENEEELTNAFFRAVAGECQLVQGVAYKREADSPEAHFVRFASFAYVTLDDRVERFEKGETLLGQVAINGEPLYLAELPPEYRVVASGLGQSSPSYLFVVPIALRGTTLGVIEMAFFRSLTEDDRLLIGGLAGSLAGKLAEQGDARECKLVEEP